MDPIEEAELRWALCWAEGDLGLKSNFGAIMACLILGVSYIGGEISTEINERCYENATRERRVRRKLEHLNKFDRLMLDLVFGERKWKLQLLGKLSLVSLFTPIVQKQPNPCAWLLETHWRAMQGEMDQIQVLKKVRTEAETILERACDSYTRAGAKRIT